MNIETDFTNYQERINQLLARFLLDPAPLSKSLYDAMRYSVLSGGKRLRPLLVYMIGSALGLSLESVDHTACALELIHAYSLIHDDLPSMDDDDWRRGKPSCHKQFGEGMALLAGDSLQILAFDVLLRAPFSSSKIVKMLSVLTKAAGPWGMVAGQAMEFSSAASLDTLDIDTIHALKTGTLFAACLELPGIIAGLSAEDILHLSKIGKTIGLAYQIQDDICDNEKNAYWHDPMLRKTYLESLINQVLSDLRSIFPLHSPQNQGFKQLLITIFPSISIDIIYQKDRENSFL